MIMNSKPASLKTISDFLQVSKSERDIGWLQSALETAIELELATLPPYLCAWWSIIKDSPDSPPSNKIAADIIFGIILEEMLHMGLACNLLVSIGGKPKITTPRYPGYLPGGVHPHLEVYLAGLTREHLQDFIEIERPEHPITQQPIMIVRTSDSSPAFLALNTEAPPKEDPTIGDFYDAILTAFQDLKPEYSTVNQVPEGFLSPNDLFVITNLDDVEKAITEIKQQGEGTSSSPDTDPQFGGQLAHFYKFSEIFVGKTFIQQKDGTWAFDGDGIPFPTTHPMAKVPSGGWPEPPGGWPENDHVKENLHDFNKAYATLLESLENAWNGNPDDVEDALESMHDLSSFATKLMQVPLPDGTGNYGPEFLV